MNFLRELREEAGLADSVAIAGVIGPRRDGYDPATAPGAAEAQDHHAAQGREPLGARTNPVRPSL